MTHAALDDRITLAHGVRLQWEPTQECNVLLYPEGMVQLNQSASTILELCDGRRVVDILKTLNEQFPDAEDLEDDVRAFLEDAYDRGWIQTKA